MSQSKEINANDHASEALICNRCDNEVQESDEFCPHCGDLFRDNIHCIYHPKQDAEGVCIICCKLLCSKCGGWINNLFLCENHNSYEIYQGMARVYGVLDDTMAQYISNCFKQQGLHPYIYYRHQPLRGPRQINTLYAASGDYDGHIIHEIKIMVPCHEVIEAEKILKDLKVKE